MPQTVTAIASPAGRVEKSSMPIHATPASARPIQTPLPRSANSATIRSAVTAVSLIVEHLGRRDGGLLAADREHELVDHRDGEHDRA